MPCLPVSLLGCIKSRDNKICFFQQLDLSKSADLYSTGEGLPTYYHFEIAGCPSVPVPIITPLNYFSHFLSGQLWL